MDLEMNIQNKKSMAEYIEREKLRDALYEADAITMRGVAILNSFPAADVAPVRHGEWDDTRVAFYLKCSECGCCVRAFVGEVFLDYAQGWNYCPNCGALMDKDGDEEDTEPWLCLSCRHYPPSSTDGKPCTQCDPSEVWHSCYDPAEEDE